MGKRHETGVGINNRSTYRVCYPNTTFYTSISDSRNGGVIPNNTWNRTSFRLNGTAQTGALSVWCFSLTTSIRAEAVFHSLTSWNDFPTGIPVRMLRNYEFEDGRHRSDSETGLGTGRNPLFDAYNNTYEDNVNRIIGNINATLDLTEWLALD